MKTTRKLAYADYVTEGIRTGYLVGVIAEQAGVITEDAIEHLKKWLLQAHYQHGIPSTINPPDPINETDAPRPLNPEQKISNLLGRFWRGSSVRATAPPADIPPGPHAYDIASQRDMLCTLIERAACGLDSVAEDFTQHAKELREFSTN